MSVVEQTEGSVEIERKFLLRALPDLTPLKARDVAQGYLTSATDSVEMRVRRKGCGADAAHFMTLKSDGTLLRKEIEVPISADQFDSFWPATKGRRVEKTRYVGVLADGLRFELDVFHGGLDGLKLVEVEFATVEAASRFVAPDWFGEDVTSNKGYKNKSLAVNGLP
ncbi:CYTH domain-containing protein [uncultured Cohaesibacter sp.]|uniref:CYTH domain-containing protein n=1 Tax=uncultured Cohaesibacter sp. TaxID=1002546 RepID=UPI0029C85DA2|nr:CYTH domain-containing protein [uncultured Cohaesibacter sp.]